MAITKFQRMDSVTLTLFYQLASSPINRMRKQENWHVYSSQIEVNRTRSFGYTMMMMMMKCRETGCISCLQPLAITAEMLKFSVITLFGIT